MQLNDHDDHGFENHDIPDEKSNTVTWDVQPQKKVDADQIIKDWLDTLLEPYEPAQSEKESDVQWTTNEILQSLETHYGVPQGDAENFSMIEGKELVTELKKRGFVAVNTGDLQLQWLMKKKIKAQSLK